MTGAVVGTATATGAGVVVALAACCARMGASNAVASLWSCASLDLPSVDCVESVEVVEGDWLLLPAVAPLVLAVVPEPALLASDGWLAFAALPEALFAGGGFGELLAGAALLLALSLLARLARALFAGGGGGTASALFWDGGGGGGSADAESCGVLWLTKWPKRSLPGDVLARASHAGEAWNAAFAAAAVSGVALTTGRPPTKKLT